MTKDKYCVYIHTDLDGNAFYVGSGTEMRASRKELGQTRENSSFRGHKYSAKVKELGYNYNVVILYRNLTMEVAREIEIAYYDQFNVSLTNNRRPVEIVKICKDTVEKYVYYDESSETGIRWKIPIYCGRGRLSYNVGDVAGSRSTSGWRVCIDSVEYYVRRVIMVLQGYSVDGMIVDHIDGNKFNNKLSNLRVVSYAENTRNKKIQANNTSGITGVVFSKNKSGSSYFVAQWSEMGKVKRKYFSIDANGFDLAKQLAYEYRKDKIKQLNDNGHGYSEDHGERS